MPFGLAPIEFIATVLALVVLIKIIVIIINKKIWLDKVAEPVYKNSKASSVVLIILALVILYYLLQELSIIQIYAVVAFSSALIGFGLMRYSKEFLQTIRKVYSKKLDSWSWVSIIIFVILSLWVLNNIFF